jgi:hypothetical protein
MRYLYQAYIIYNTNLSYILTYITSKKIISFSFCEYKLPYIFPHVVF